MTMLHSMYVHDDDPGHTLNFEVNLRSAHAMSLLKLVHYIEVKFDAARSPAGSMKHHDHPFGTVGLRFPESTYAEAKRFCRDNIMDNGSPTLELHEKVEEADLPETVVHDLFWQMSGKPANPYRRDVA